MKGYGEKGKVRKAKFRIRDLREYGRWI